MQSSMPLYAAVFAAPILKLWLLYLLSSTPAAREPPVPALQNGTLLVPCRWQIGREVWALHLWCWGSPASERLDISQLKYNQWTTERPETERICLWLLDSHTMDRRPPYQQSSNERLNWRHPAEELSSHPHRETPKKTKQQAATAFLYLDQTTEKTTHSSCAAIEMA